MFQFSYVNGVHVLVNPRMYHFPNEKKFEYRPLLGVETVPVYHYYCLSCLLLSFELYRLSLDQRGELITRAVHLHFTRFITNL